MRTSAQWKNIAVEVSDNENAREDECSDDIISVYSVAPDGTVIDSNEKTPPLCNKTSSRANFLPMTHSMSLSNFQKKSASPPSYHRSKGFINTNEDIWSVATLCAGRNPEIENHAEIRPFKSTDNRFAFPLQSKRSKRNPATPASHRSKDLVFDVEDLWSVATIMEGYNPIIDYLYSENNKALSPPKAKPGLNIKKTASSHSPRHSLATNVKKREHRFVKTNEWNAEIVSQLDGQPSRKKQRFSI